MGTGPPSEWRQHWSVLVPCLAGILLASVHAYSLGVMIGPLEQEFGWSRAEITTGPFIISFIALLSGPLVGVAIDRVGPRRIALFGVFVFCVALAFLSTATSNILSWWARWAALGVAVSFILPTVWTTAINSLFSVNRGKALAFALVGTGLGAALVPSLTNFLIEWRGWRQAYIGLAVIFVLVVAPLVFFLFRGATDRVSSSVGRSAGAMLPGLSAREGFRSPSFYKLTLAVMVFGVTSIALTTNAVPVLITQGFDGAAAAGLAGLIGIGSIIGRLGGGFLLDYFDAKRVAAVSAVFPIVTVALLLALPGSAWPAAIACLALGLSVGTEVDACAYLAARHFGMRSFGALFGTINGLLVFTTGMAPVIANYVYDVTRSYDLVLYALVPICLVAASLFLLLGRYPAFAGGRGEALRDRS